MEKVQKIAEENHLCSLPMLVQRMGYQGKNACTYVRRKLDAAQVKPSHVVRIGGTTFPLYGE